MESAGPLGSGAAGARAPGQPSSAYRAAPADCPLVVDLDGTLTRTDTLMESVVRAVKRRPLDMLRLPLWLLNGRAGFKARLAERVTLPAASLPYCEPLLDYLRAERLRGRRLILATAAHVSIANAVAAHLRLFERVLATDDRQNLKGAAKLDGIRAAVGARFAYAGDSAADIPVWRAAESALLIGTSRRVGPAVRQSTPVELEIPAPVAGAKVWLRAIRAHQWTKNLLIFVPLLASFSFLDRGSVVAACLAFVAFSAAASATYLINDLWDLESDRAHPRKRSRPLAAGGISIPSALGVSFILLMIAAAISAAETPGFTLLLLMYLALTTAYSLLLKEYVIVDVLTLAALYTIRILAGSLAIGVTTSSWLLAFSVFIFFSLALVKRCSELVSLREAQGQAARGRDYGVPDLVVLWPMGIGASLCATVVFGLFISAIETEGRYASPQLLWLVGLGLIYWLARLWIKTARGEMHDDPIVFALRDRGSRVTIAAMALVTLAAHFVRL